MVDSCVMHTGKVRLKRGKMVRAASSVRLPQSDCERWADGRVNGPAGLFPRFRPRLRTLHPALSPTPCGHASAQPALGATSFPLITAVDFVRIMHFFSFIQEHDMEYSQLSDCYYYVFQLQSLFIVMAVFFELVYHSTGSGVD